MCPKSHQLQNQHVGWSWGLQSPSRPRHQPGSLGGGRGAGKIAQSPTKLTPSMKASLVTQVSSVCLWHQAGHWPATL